uniref:WW domain-binding protein 2-like n=1 Tax=Phallusia mammillata TaxID=59560 RepID=A0A6F9DW47_9ASCI|nr:WW domain-binding protein 2-like [Phallusia mammillata]
MTLNQCTGTQLFLSPGEMIIRQEENVNVTFKKFTHSNEHMKGSKTGNVYLTNYRLIFKNSKSSDMMQELSMPFRQIKDFEIKQPVFGANFLQGKIVAEKNGGWEGSAFFEITFKSGGAIDIGQQLVKLATKPPQPMYQVQTTTVVYPTASVPGAPVAGSSNAYYFPAQNGGAAPPHMYPPTAPPMYPQQAPGPANPPAYPQQGYANMNPDESKLHNIILF